MKLKALAEAAIEFYGTPNLLVRKPPEDGKTKAARYVCQWVACEALIPRYKQSDVARFWGMDGSTVHYGRKMVNDRIDTCPAEKTELKKFMAFIKKKLFECGLANQQRINGTKRTNQVRNTL